MQVGRLTAHKLLEAQEAPRSIARRRLAVLVRIHDPDFIWAPQLLAWREDHPLAEWDFYFMMSNQDSAERLTEFLTIRGKSHLAKAYTVLLVGMWAGAQGQPLSGMYAPNWPSLKQIAGLLAVHPCYDMITGLDAEMTIIRPEMLVAAVESRIRHGHVFASLPTKHFIEAHSLSWPLGMWAGSKYRDHLNTEFHNFTMFISFSDMYAFDARDIPSFLSETNITFRNQWLNMEMIEDEYLTWKVARRERSVAPVFISSRSSFFLEGVIWQMRKGADWLAIRDAYNNAPTWVHVGLCYDFPVLCKTASNNIVVVHSLDWNKHVETKFASALDSCLENKLPVRNPLQVFLCALEAAPPPQGELYG